jgi:undecaprenyl-diphosphatase
MDFFDILTLSLIQGFTEFLPISSSAHLILAPKFFDFADQGLMFDVALHFGTLLAIVSYFWKDLTAIFGDFFKNYNNANSLSDGRYVAYVFFATIPVGVCGLLFDDFISSSLRSPLVIATTTLLFGLLLLFADKKSAHKDEFDLKGAMIVGIFQALALIPGTSRSGITMTAALLLGYDRVASARFSFLLSIPVIFLAALFKSMELMGQSQSVAIVDLLLAVVFSFVSALICVKLFLQFIQQIGFSLFVGYRVLLSVILFWMYI